ncbi:hypothetical protein [Spirosoma sp.]|uniref:Bor/Iss family lipoprotein n=1 Tax=Spirosoma sp. TaxID=1899569 RepID=UPI00263488BD|nr:hypothetical protein [Spirosoma sp.]MCX6214201.1 hypothetical protein [Spirosoma sp.]
MKKALLSTFVVVSGSILMSCNATMHTVGTGGPGDCKSPGQYDAKKKQWYIFWGLLPLNNVDSKALAGGSKNYTIRTTTSFGDGLIAIPGSYLLGIRTQTIRVSKGKE